MNEETTNANRRTLRRLLHAISNVLQSSVGGRARLLLAALFGLMLCINGMNVANSYVGRYFMSAIESRDTPGFVRFAWLYVAVFATSTLVGVLFRFTEERLGLVWREWLTRRITEIYVTRRLYLLQATGEEALSNPDQRMTDDVRQLTTTTLSFVLLMINATLTVLSFSGVLWQISPKLFLVAVLYALVGSAVTIWLGRPLIRLNYGNPISRPIFASNSSGPARRRRRSPPPGGKRPSRRSSTPASMTWWEICATSSR